MTRWFALAAAACGAAAWRWFAPWPGDDPVLALVALRSPLTAACLQGGYALAWIATPYALARLAAAAAGRLIDLCAPGREPQPLPPWPGSESLQLTIGELHRRTLPGPSPQPRWLTVPRRGLHAGVAVFGAVGSGKTSSCMYPFAQQLLGWQAAAPDRRAGGLVLEVKGDFCHQVRRLLAACGRDADYLELSLAGRWCYNPLAADLDAYSLAFQLASLLNQLFGKGKEPFWQQASTNLVKFLILLHRLVDDYVTLQDVYRAALDGALLERKLAEARQALGFTPQIHLPSEEYSRVATALPRRLWDYDALDGTMFVPADAELAKALEDCGAAFETREPPAATEEQRRLRAVLRWHEHDWLRLDERLRSSIVEGVSVFLSLFDQPEIADVFCPPRAVYREGAPHRGRWPLPPLDDLLEDGRVLALNLPIGANPALARAIGVMLKQDFQRAALARIPRIAQEPDRSWRDLLFLCDEYQIFATAGENEPGGDEKFFSLSRQARVIAIVATQSISSLRSALPGESWRTLLQTFRTRVFLTLADEASCRQASEACGQAERLKEQYSIAESSQASVGLLSGRAGGSKGTFGVTKSYAPRREAVFPPSAFAELRNAQAIVAAYDGANPLPATYCYLKPHYLPRELGYFEAAAEGLL